MGRSMASNGAQPARLQISMDVSAGPQERVTSETGASTLVGLSGCPQAPPPLPAVWQGLRQGW